MIYIWCDYNNGFQGYRIGNVSPDNDDYGACIKESIFVPVPPPYLPETEANIARNVLMNGGAKVTIT